VNILARHFQRNDEGSKMKGERYTIEVSDDEVLIHGYLSIREAFDFLSFFDQQGYDTLWPGDENSAMRIVKKKVTYDTTA
jgi:hypothetical protein